MVDSRNVLIGLGTAAAISAASFGLSQLGKEGQNQTVVTSTPTETPTATPKATSTPETKSITLSKSTLNSQLGYLRSQLPVLELKTPYTLACFRAETLTDDPTNRASLNAVSGRIQRNSPVDISLQVQPNTPIGSYDLTVRYHISPVDSNNNCDNLNETVIDKDISYIVTD